MRLLTVLMLMLPTGMAHAGAGTTQAEFLKIGLSPRAAAMGGAFGAVADDLGAIEYNPAGLSQLNNSQVSAQYVQWIGDVRFASLAGAHVVPFLGTVGVSLSTLDIGGGLLGTKDIEGSLKNFAALGYVIRAAWSRALREDVCVGAGAKILEEDIGTFASSGFAVDAGALYTPMRGASLGLAILNLGTAAAFEREKNGLPLLIKLAGAWKGMEGEYGQVIASADLDWAPKPRNRLAPSFGVEYWGGRYFALRAGYALTDTDLSELVGFSAGLGVRAGAFRFDLAYAPFSALGQAIRGSVNWEIWPLVTLGLPGSSVGEPRALSGTRVQLPAPPYVT
ncbi:MAG: PorV/PorQ family protein, partial [bacterium]